jgi:cation:H+ antiporter
MVIAALAIAAGLALLAMAPDRFVDGAAGLADRWGLSRVLIGAVVIGFGTSTPELLVSGIAAAGGDAAVGVGNIVGSNLANLALVVPIAALIAPLAVPGGLLRTELPLVGLATVVFAVVVQGGLTRPEGVLLAVLLVASLAVIVRRAERPAVGADADLGADVDEFLADERTESVGRLALTALGGLVATLVGAQLLVSGAVEIADRAGLSGGFVGLTVVAIGTSLPELVTAVAAARAGEDGLILGNVIGSNLFNCLAVGATVAFLGPGPIGDTHLTTGAVLLMLAVTAGAAVIMLRGRQVTRNEAIGLLVVYLATLPLLAG